MVHHDGLKMPDISESAFGSRKIRALSWKEENDIERIIETLEDACKKMGRSDILEQLDSDQKRYKDIHILDMIPDEGVVLFNVDRRVFKTKNSQTLPNGPQFYEVETLTRTVQSVRFTSAAIRILHSKDFSDEQHVRQLSAAAKFIGAEDTPSSNKITHYLQMVQSGQLKPMTFPFHRNIEFLRVES